jgi:chitinase
MIVLEGWNEGSKKYSYMDKSPQLRTRFVKSVVEFLDEHGFDGIDMDWEFPGPNGGDIKEDKIHFIELIAELKAELDPNGYVLSAAVSNNRYWL